LFPPVTSLILTHGHSSKESEQVNRRQVRSQLDCMRIQMCSLDRSCAALLEARAKQQRDIHLANLTESSYGKTTP